MTYFFKSAQKYPEADAFARESVHTASVPQFLKQNAVFCLWRYEDRDGKPSKVPKNPNTGKNADSTDPNTFVVWKKLEEVWKQAQDQCAGIGIGIFEDTGAIDIDHCVDESGNLSPMARDIVDMMDTYTELSPSRTGIRILFTATGFEYDKGKYYINKKQIGLEVYVAGATNKYVSITGNVLDGIEKPIRDCRDKLPEFLDKYMKRQTKTVRQSTHSVPVSGKERPKTRRIEEDCELIERASNASNGETFKRLWNGNASDYAGLNSDGTPNDGHSEADLALCNILAFWTGKDAARMDRLFRKSGLMRDKWDRKQSGTTYGNITIQKAIEACMDVYVPKEKESATAENNRKSLEPDDRTDIGQAAVFRDVYGEKVRYSKATDFLIYNGVKWCEDSIHAQKLAQELTDRQLKEARKRCTATNKALLQAKESEDEDRIKAAMEADNAAKSYFSYVLGRRKNSSINNTLSQVRSMVQIRVEDLDADPYLLNTPGGAVDLRTGKIRENRPEDYCTKATAVCPSAEGADLFSQFMETVTDGDQDLIQYLQIVAGMCAVGMVKQEKLIIAYGEGGTGKSTFFNLLFSLFGDYSGMLSAETLTTGQRDNKKPELAELRGKRLIIAAELEEGTRMNTAMVKKLCSTDPIHAAKKFKDEFEFIPSHTVILYTNHLPKVGTSDSGTWRRLTVVPFQHKFSDTSGEIKNYAEYLLSHAGGAVLSWVIEGATRFIRDHYKIEEPGCVRRAIDSYKEENDWLGHFIEECCEIGNSYEAPAGPLYDRYRRFCEESGEYTRNVRDFKNAMERAGYEYKRGTGGKRLYIGIQQKCHFEPIPAGIKTPFEEGA